MTQIGTRLVLAAMLFAMLVPAAPAAPSNDAPRIVDCRIGWLNQYKVGHWTPMWVDVAGALPAATGPQAVPGPAAMRIDVTVPDPDGVATTFTATAAVDAASSLDSSGGQFSVPLYVKIGRVGSTVSVTLVVDGKAVDRVALRPMAPGKQPQPFSRPILGRKHSDPLPKGEGAPHPIPLPKGEGEITPGLPSTAELMVSVGPVDLAEAFPDREAEGGELFLRTVHLQRIADLPTEWFGYEGIDTLVLSTGDLELCRQLAGDHERLTAIDRWVKLGGRLVVLCGRHAPELVAAGQPLAALVPGTFVRTIRLTQTNSLEHFSQSEVPIARGGAQGEVVVAQLRDVAGRIDAFAGGKPGDLPLVVRAPHGMGELAFLGVDLDAAPLADWPGRTSFLRALLRPYTVASDLTSMPQTLVTLGYNDLSGALRQRLGQSFPSVRAITFPLVALLVIGYLVLLGPGDYLLVRRFERHRWVAWVTFPILVVATSGGAYWLGAVQRGEASVNQLELVDVDLTTGTARGTYWAVLYSPQAERYDLALDVRSLAGRPSEELQTLLSWLGLPGTGLGGMHATSVERGIITNGYRFAPTLDALDDVPLLTSSTKSLLARWTAPVEPLISAQLAEDADGLLVGTLANRTGQTLTDARLLYGGWAYRLGDLPHGGSVRVDESTSTIQVKTLIARAARGDTHSLGGAEGQPLLADQAEARQLLAVMMFYQAAGGYGFAKLLDQYQAYCDFSRSLDLGRAVLVAGGSQAGSTLVDPSSGRPLRHNEDPGNVVYRFILPVENSY